MITAYYYYVDCGCLILCNPGLKNCRHGWGLNPQPQILALCIDWARNDKNLFIIRIQRSQIYLKLMLWKLNLVALTFYLRNIKFQILSPRENNEAVEVKEKFKFKNARKVKQKETCELFLPSDTRALALHPSDPIQLKCPVAFILFTAFISSATSWSEPKTITPTLCKYWKLN